MAINAYKALSITNLDATPILRANPWVHGGNSKQYAGTVEVADDASIGSIYRFFRVGSWMRPVSLTILCDAITGAAADVGLYRRAADGGAAVDADIFASAQSIATASKTGIMCLFESGSNDVANVEKRIWELLGLTADPNLEYDLALTLTAGLSAAGTLALQGVFSW
jgi:hypothetical protein